MKIIKSFAFAFAGVKICFTSETNFKIHAIAAVLVIILGFALRISNTEWLIIIGCIAFVITMEMLNTAIEKLCDVVQESLHPGIKKVKDIAAGAVMVSAVCVAIIGVIIFLPKIIFCIKSL
jgi:diacylglycerol kinase